MKPRPAPSTHRPLPTLLACAGILALALFLRVPYMDWGVPGFVAFDGRPVGYLQPDETALVAQTRRDLETGRPFPVDEMKYGPLQPILAALLLRVAGTREPGEAQVYLACRWVSIAASTASVLLLLLVGLRWGPGVGLLASLFLAVALIPARDARWADPDPLCACLVLGALLLSLRALDRPASGTFAAAGLCLGLAAATKAFAVLFVHLPFLASRAVCRAPAGGAEPAERFLARRTILGTLCALGALAGGLLAVLCLAPEAVQGLAERALLLLYRSDPGGAGHAHPAAFWLEHLHGLFPAARELAAAVLLVLLAMSIAGCLAMRSDRLGPLRARLRFLAHRKAWLALAVFAGSLLLLMGPVVCTNPVGFVSFVDHHMKWAGATGKFGVFPSCRPVPSYAFTLLPAALGWPLYLLALAGIVRRLPARDRWEGFCLLAVLPYAALLEANRYHVLRFSLPLLPVLCLFAALFLRSLWRSPRRILRGLAPVLLVLVLAHGLVRTLAFVEAMDPAREVRIQAARWMRENLPAGATVGVRGYNVHPWTVDPLDHIDGLTFVTYDAEPEFVVLPAFTYGVMHRFLELRQQGCTYVPEDWWPFDPPSEADIAFYEGLLLEKTYRLVKRFDQPTTFAGVSFDPCRLPSEHLCTLTNPVIRIYARRRPFLP